MKPCCEPQFSSRSLRTITRCDLQLQGSTAPIQRQLFYLHKPTSQLSAASSLSLSTEVNPPSRPSEEPDDAQPRWRLRQSGGLRIRISCSPRCSGALQPRACACSPSHTSRLSSWRIGALVRTLASLSPSQSALNMLPNSTTQGSGPGSPWARPASALSPSSFAASSSSSSESPNTTPACAPPTRPSTPSFAMLPGWRRSRRSSRT